MWDGEVGRELLNVVIGRRRGHVKVKMNKKKTKDCMDVWRCIEDRESGIL